MGIWGYEPPNTWKLRKKIEYARHSHNRTKQLHTSPSNIETKLKRWEKTNRSFHIQHLYN